MTSNTKVNKKVIICGAGLVGSLNACFFAQNGWIVEVYETRGDPRSQQFVHGRSINLAASVRARSALAVVGLEEQLVTRGIPMYARYVHNLDGKSGFAVPYGKKDQYILSVNRRELNESMLTEAEKCKSVRMYFNEKVTYCDPVKGEVVLQNQTTKTEKRATADLILGCDGAYSAVRKCLMKQPGFNFSQHYIEHGYIELCIMPSDTNEFKMPPNFFHLWPRGDFTLIALANLDKTFTVTLFAPWTVFKTLDSPQNVLHFFKSNFPDALAMIGRDSVTETFAKVKASALVSVKCSPHQFHGKVLLMGDAAHAMVPFYGQGMNCGFEDCLILHQLLAENENNIQVTLEAYNRKRVVDAEAICDLALYNYKELCYLVNTRKFRLRKKFDLLLHACFPKFWIPLYSSVTFSRMRYHHVIHNKDWQDKILNRLMLSSGIGIFAGSLLFAFKLLKKFQD